MWKKVGSACPRVAKNNRDGGDAGEVAAGEDTEGKKDAVSEDDAGGEESSGDTAVVDAAGGDNAREHTIGGVAHSTGVMPQAQTHSQVVQTHSASPCHMACPMMDKKRGDFFLTPGLAPCPGLILNCELSQPRPTGSSSYIPAQG